MKIISTPYIEFKTEDKYWDVIPKPYPAGRLIPNWFKTLPGFIKDPEDSRIGRTVKRCSPFVDALNLGWIIPLAADVELEVKEGKIFFNYTFPHKLVDIHGNEQLNGSQGPTKGLDALKFINHWSIKVAKGYSVLFVPPLNRSNDTFEAFSGVVECDKYWNYINLPVRLLKDNFTTLIEQGTPLVQVIPFPRISQPKKCVCKSLTVKEKKVIKKVQDKIYAHISHYRDDIWSKGKCPFVKN